MDTRQPGKPELRIVGGGLAGCEAAWQAAERGVRVALAEMRPARSTPAHRTGALAELVCSNSFGSTLPDRASGILQGECRRLDSLLMREAVAAAVPAGSALAVDRDRFSSAVSGAIRGHPRIRVECAEAVAIPGGPAILATGPLTSPAFSAALAGLAGAEHLFFFDALAPIVEAETIDRTVAFAAARYGRGGAGDYLNCPFDRAEYEAFLAALRGARRVEPRPFERGLERGVRTAYFEACLPVEVLASRGDLALAFGPLRPAGLRDPRTGRRPYAVAQLRRENLAASLFNLVGFQTSLAEGEQDRVFRMIPGLARARFVRHGRMHRNTYLRTPGRIRPTLQWRGREDLFLAGQLIGVEGYAGSVATGWLAGVNAARLLRGRPPLAPPPETLLGALCRHVSAADPGTYQPMKANLGLLPPLEGPGARRRAKAAALAARSARALETWRRLLDPAR